jgi:hypothetical protein
MGEGFDAMGFAELGAAKFLRVSSPPCPPAGKVIHPVRYYSAINHLRFLHVDVTPVQRLWCRGDKRKLTSSSVVPHELRQHISLLANRAD